jgi:RNA polymerase sigma-70 factor (ECF subfamily)
VTHRATAAFALGRAEWPTIRGLTLDAFQAFVSEASIEPDALEERAGDVYLAAAAASGDEEAVKTFDRDLLAELPRWLSRLHLPPDLFEEVRQLLRAKLLVGRPPKLAQYRASGPLGAWVRVAAMRTALDLFSADALAADANRGLGDPLLSALDPEEQLIRRKYGAAFESAMRDALGELSRWDRNLLRFHYVSRMSLDAIGRTYHVNRATVVRWLAAIRDELETAVRARLWHDLGVSPTELRSLWNAVGSEVDVSLSRLLVGG